jgi:hypothetical protein
VADLMFDLLAECGAALVMVTHDPVLAERADRIVRMADGNRCRSVSLSASASPPANCARASAASHLPGLPGAGRRGHRRRQLDGRGLPSGLASQAREILGGDLSPRSRTALHAPGARRLRQDGQGVLHRPRGCHGPGAVAAIAAWSACAASTPSIPLAGAVELEGAKSGRGPGHRDGLPGAAVEPALLDRLHLKIGDRFEAGPLTLVVRARMVSEPDGVRAASCWVRACWFAASCWTAPACSRPACRRPVGAHRAAGNQDPAPSARPEEAVRRPLCPRPL